MALISCKECGHRISKKTKTCPNCGAYKKGHIGAIPSLIIISLFVWFLAASHKDENRGGIVASSYHAVRNSWAYADYPDEMGRGKIKEAEIQSQNQISFGFPYNGLQRATLTLIKHPKYGNHVIITIEKGQFLCGQGACVSVKFGNEKVEAFLADEPSDHGTTTLFIRNYDRFVSKLRKSSVVKIEAQFFQESTRVFEFNTAGLVW